LKETAIRPHRSQYWLNPTITDQKAHELEVSAVCDVYRSAKQLATEGVRVISCDEKTGMQALERAAMTRPMTRGHVEKREFEYVRHGTTCLIANLDVATGTIVAPTLGPTRDEKDFALHILHTVASQQSAKWVFVVDNLTTHVSETLVRIVAKHDGLDIDLGVKGVRDILKNVESRRAFLVDKTHRIRFVYTPKHCSWLNQIECWFSILARRVLRRGSFASVDMLNERVLDFIAYFNRILAQPVKWTFTGKARAG